MRNVLGLALLAAALAGTPWAAAQSLANAQLSGTIDGVSTPPAGFPSYGGSFSLTYKCTGTPTCIGTYQMVEQDNKCTTPIAVSGQVTIGGLALAKPGSFTGSLQLDGVTAVTRRADGTCAAGITYSSLQQFAGTWDGTNGTIAIDMLDAEVPPATIRTRGTFKVDSAAVPFPMTVSALIDSQTSTASAVIQLSAQAVASKPSVWLFAMAPKSIVKFAPGDPKADSALPCVLAYLTGTGQLQSVSPDALKAYISGVLNAGNQAITVLNNVPTVNIAGATFYVGVGTTYASMYGSGATRAVVSVPGNNACKSERPKTGWWWRPDQGGQGFSIEAHDDVIFLASYIFDSTGQASWLAAAGKTTLEGAAFQGDLQSYANGQSLASAYKAPSVQQSPGTIALTFQDSTHGVLSWPGGNVAIERFDMVPGGTSLPAVAGQPESGWWWNDQETGRGYFIEWQGANAYLAAYMYGPSGSSIWYASQATTPDITRYNGALLYFLNGQTLTGAYRPPNAGGSMGQVSITFTGPDTATLTLPGGAPPMKIKRFRF